MTTNVLHSKEAIPLPLPSPETASTASDKQDLEAHDAHDAHDEKNSEKKGDEHEASILPPNWASDELLEEDKVIVTGADAANYLLPIRDDGDPALTIRSIVLGTLVAAFQASMSQIYSFKPTSVGISSQFIILIVWFFGRAWAYLLPRGDKLEAKWRAKGEKGKKPWWLRLAIAVNPGPFGLKEHAIAAITATSASNGTASISVFTVQELFYDVKITATNVVLSTLSIGLFGYGLTGLLRPMTVWAVEAVYWTNIPVVKILQALHWDTFKVSKPLRVFWYSFGGMFVYEFFPAYIFPWLNSVSVPCLASMKTTGSRAAVLTNLFGGSLSNEGLGILNFSFDWQYITSASTAMPLKLQTNFAIGLVICWFAFLMIYYLNAWGAKDLPFLSTALRTNDGGRYPIAKVFVNGVLDRQKLEEYGLPRLTGTYTWAMMVGNAAIGAVIAHCILFWGKDILAALKAFRTGQTEDRHHEAMKRYKEAPWYWYAGILVFAFVLGLAVVIKEHLTLPVWAYIVALLLGAFIAPFSTMLYSRFGNGIATNSLMKMVAGAMLPGRPLANLYFSAWSHSVIAQSLNLAADLKLGEYLKIPPRTMFLTQIWGTVFGAFINYAVMISIVSSHRDILADTNGTYAWSGQAFQSMNTQAAAWALAKDLYNSSGRYVLVPVGIAIGFGLVAIHRLVVIVLPRIGKIDLRDLNIPTLLMYSGWLGYNQTQSCVVLSGLLAGFYVQYYLRNYRPKIFKNYMYLVTSAWDGASLFVLFILSFAVFGAGNKPAVPFPSWWGNPSTGFIDHCPSSD